MLSTCAARLEKIQVWLMFLPRHSHINLGSLRAIPNRLCAHNARASIFLSKRQREMRETEKKKEDRTPDVLRLLDSRIKCTFDWLCVTLTQSCETGYVPGTRLWDSCPALEFWKGSQVRLMKQLCKPGVLSLASPSLACVLKTARSTSSFVKR